MRELKLNDSAELEGVKKYTLEQYTPHIHFQADEEGACLRASEVKPKLDKFLLSYLSRKKLFDSVPEEWFIVKEDENKRALNYKVSVCGIGTPTLIDNFRNTSYFGNMGDSNDKKGVLYKSGLELTVIAGAQTENRRLNIGNNNYSLLGLVDYCLPAFFTFNCFGTRNTKGWGSYGIHSVKVNEKYLLDFVDVFYTIPVVKRMSGNQVKGSDALEEIRILSNMMKAGINMTAERIPRDKRGYYKGRIYCYFLDKIKSDKKFMKSRLFDRNNDDSKYLYLRAMLGLAENVEFKDKDRRGIIEIKDSEGNNNRKITRFNNPVHFIPSDSEIYILPTKINNILSNRKFIFRLRSVRAEISTPVLGEFTSEPQKGRFNLEAFLDWFRDQVNCQIDIEEAPREVKNILEQKINKVGGNNGK